MTATSHCCGYGVLFKHCELLFGSTASQTNAFSMRLWNFLATDCVMKRSGGYRLFAE